MHNEIGQEVHENYINGFSKKIFFGATGPIWEGQIVSLDARNSGSALTILWIWFFCCCFCLMKEAKWYIKIILMVFFKKSCLLLFLLFISCIFIDFLFLFYVYRGSFVILYLFCFVVEIDVMQFTISNVIVTIVF